MDSITIYILKTFKVMLPIQVSPLISQPLYHVTYPYFSTYPRQRHLILSVSGTTFPLSLPVLCYFSQLLIPPAIQDISKKCGHLISITFRTTHTFYPFHSLWSLPHMSPLFHSSCPWLSSGLAQFSPPAITAFAPSSLGTSQPHAHTAAGAN